MCIFVDIGHVMHWAFRIGEIKHIPVNCVPYFISVSRCLLFAALSLAVDYKRVGGWLRFNLHPATNDEGSDITSTED